MSERMHALAQLLPGKASLEECSVEELQHLTKRYPFFAPFQFLLLQKLRAAGSPDYEAQQRKAVLYFHDPLQFDHFISSDKFYFPEGSFPGHKQAGIAPVTAEAMDAVRPGAEVVVDEGSFLPPQADASETPAAGSSQPEETLLPAAALALPEETEVSEATEAVAKSETSSISDSEQSTKPGEDTALPPAQASSNDRPEELVQEETFGPETMSPTATAEPALQTGTGGEQSVETGGPGTGISTEQPEAPAGPADSATDTTVSVSPHNKSSTPPLFEPYHMVDYFASQGIRVSAEDLPKDRLGKQLRSFTEWLKMMKRLPDVEMAKTPQTSAEKTVVNLASHSVEESNVITEAMAEVWIKQGAREKAIETYNKLSLLNPSKKAYFAAKIENLRGS